MICIHVYVDISQKLKDNHTTATFYFDAYAIPDPKFSLGNRSSGRLECGPISGSSTFCLSRCMFHSPAVGQNADPQTKPKEPNKEGPNGKVCLSLRKQIEKISGID